MGLDNTAKAVGLQQTEEGICKILSVGYSNYS